MSEALEAALAERDDLDPFGAAKRTLFALQLSRDLEDVASVAASAVTDGPDDKSCDVVYVDRDAGSILLAQGYEATVPRPQAPNNKAGSLHQAVNWLFGAQSASDVPERLREAWREVHEALADGAIKDIEIWLVHNLPESSSIASELKAVERAAYLLTQQRYSIEDLSVAAREVGVETLTDRYEGSRTPILVTDTFSIPVSGSFLEQGENWSAVCTSIPASWLHEQFATHGQRLFSANIRGYLGSQRAQGNINNGIQRSARESPRQFWAYNNGITALVHSVEPADDGSSLEVRGLAIVNGAQTTGAIGSVPADAVAEGRLLARFIKCDDPATVQEIIRYNNRQNPTQASDFRSNDRVQARLVHEFSTLGVVGYNGGRRGGAEDVIRRPGENQISASVAAQALAAFHGRPDIAYHAKGQIWEADAIYSEVFPERTTARHILFAYSLLRAIEQLRLDLGNRDEGDLTQLDQDLAGWFGLRGATMLAVGAVGAVSETLLCDTAIPDRYALKFKGRPTVPAAVAMWRPVLDAVLALAPTQLAQPLTVAGALRNRSAVDTAVNTFRGIVAATRASNASLYADFARKVTQD
ncbi:AIPR family protein [Geodermatophilus sp. SYSU D00696]